MNWKRNLVLIVCVAGGIIIGGLLANLTSNISFLQWLGYGKSMGINVNSPLILDLSVFKMAFGIEIGINVSQIICIILSIFGYKAIVKKL